MEFLHVRVYISKTIHLAEFPIENACISAKSVHTSTNSACLINNFGAFKNDLKV